MRIKGLAVWLTICCIFLLGSLALGETTPTEMTVRASVGAVASDQSSLDVWPKEFVATDNSTKGSPTSVAKPCDPNSQQPGCKSLHLTVADNVVKDQLKQLHKGDYVRAVYAADASKNTLKGIRTYDVSAIDSPFWVLLTSAGACLLLYGVFSGFNPSKLVIAEDNRYSNSRFQIALWFFVLITSYIAVCWMRFVSAGWDFLGGVNIPQNLLMLSGASALTFGGAKAITTNKLAAVGVGVVKPPAAAPSFFRDLTQNDVGQFDFGDFQMLVITLIAASTYMLLVFHFLGTVEYSKVVSLPDVDTTILATFGLGQGAYLTKKAVGNVGTS